LASFSTPRRRSQPAVRAPLYRWSRPEKSGYHGADVRQRDPSPSLAAAAAGAVYTLLGKRDLGTKEFPLIDTALLDGDIGFRQHTGGHTAEPTWPTFLTFASRYLGSPVRAITK